MRHGRGRAPSARLRRCAATWGLVQLVGGGRDLEHPSPQHSGVLYDEDDGEHSALLQLPVSAPLALKQRSVPLPLDGDRGVAPASVASPDSAVPDWIRELAATAAREAAERVTRELLEAQDLSARHQAASGRVREASAPPATLLSSRNGSAGRAAAVSVMVQPELAESLEFLDTLQSSQGKPLTKNAERGYYICCFVLGVFQVIGFAVWLNSTRYSPYIKGIKRVAHYSEDVVRFVFAPGMRRPYKDFTKELSLRQNLRHFWIYAYMLVTNMTILVILSRLGIVIGFGEKLFNWFVLCLIVVGAVGFAMSKLLDQLSGVSQTIIAEFQRIETCVAECMEERVANILGTLEKSRVTTKEKVDRMRDVMKHFKPCGAADLVMESGRTAGERSGANAQDPGESAGSSASRWYARSEPSFAHEEDGLPLQGRARHGRTVHFAGRDSLAGAVPSQVFGAVASSTSSASSFAGASWSWGRGNRNTASVALLGRLLEDEVSPLSAGSSMTYLRTGTQYSDASSTSGGHRRGCWSWRFPRFGHQASSASSAGPSAQAFAGPTTVSLDGPSVDADSAEDVVAALPVSPPTRVAPPVARAATMPA